MNKKKDDEIKRMTVDELFDFIQPGQAWRATYGKGWPNNRLIHIRAVVDNVFVVAEWYIRRRS